jgi:AraC family transcriptional regulator of adaptative response / DNA-3-methyladenine glycosylase II
LRKYFRIRRRRQPARPQHDDAIAAVHLDFRSVAKGRAEWRPVCPVRPARSANVSFFPSAAAAEAAGFRPCLRCRPETAPFSSAWIGSRATVERALRLIAEEGALDQEGATVERLAERLGVGSRQLTRLFARHLQASPSKVARTARVQRAKRLLDETSLPMTEIAMRAGFGSLRRFNSVFAEVYGRPPSEIRRARRSAGKARGIRSGSRKPASAELPRRLGLYPQHSSRPPRG